MAAQLLSTSIALGRILVEKQQRCHLEGCALGMALIANSAAMSYEEIHKLWPWAAEKKYDKCPCECLCGSFHFTAADIIMHLFDSHVRGNPNLYKVWTLEQLIDFVASIEPPLPADPLEAYVSPSLAAVAR